MAAEFRNRVKELRFVRAGDLTPNEKNWREHPKTQASVLQKILSEVGYADALIARDDGGELVLLDGHLRASLTPETMVPVLIVDLTEIEADLILATLDPIAAMATTNSEAYAELISELGDSVNLDMLELLEGVEERLNALPPSSDGEQAPEADPEPVTTGAGNPAPGDNQTNDGNFVLITFRLSRDEYEDKAQLIQEAVEAIGITPHIQTIGV